MTTEMLLQNLIADKQLFQTLAEFYGENVAEKAGFKELATALIKTETTQQNFTISKNTATILPNALTSKLFLDKICGKVSAIHFLKLAPFNFTQKGGAPLILADETIIKQSKADPASRFEVQVFDKTTTKGHREYRVPGATNGSTNFVEGTYQIPFTIKDTDGTCNFGISGSKSDTKTNFAIPEPGSYIYHFTTRMNDDGTQTWYDMKITLNDGITPYYGIAESYSLPSTITGLSGYGDYNAANPEECNYFNGEKCAYVINGKNVNGIWENQEPQYISITNFSSWYNTPNKIAAIVFEGENLQTNSNILGRTFETQRVKEYTQKLSLDLSGDVEGLEYITVFADGVECGKLTAAASSLDVPLSAKIQLAFTTKEGYTYFASSGSLNLETGWNMYNNVTVNVVLEKTVVMTHTLIVDTGVGSGHLAFNGRILINNIEYVMEYEENEEASRGHWWRLNIDDGATVQLIYEDGKYNGPGVYITPYIEGWDTIEPFIMDQDYHIEIGADALYDLNIQIMNQDAFTGNSILIYQDGELLDIITQNTVITISEGRHISYQLSYDQNENWKYTITLSPEQYHNDDGSFTIVNDVTVYIDAIAISEPDIPQWSKNIP